MSEPRTLKTSFGVVVLAGDLYTQPLDGSGPSWLRFLTPRNVEHLIQVTTELLLEQAALLAVLETRKERLGPGLKLTGFKELYDALSERDLGKVRVSTLRVVVEAILGGAAPLQEELRVAHPRREYDGQFGELLEALQGF